MKKDEWAFELDGEPSQAGRLLMTLDAMEEAKLKRTTEYRRARLRELRDKKKEKKNG